MMVEAWIHSAVTDTHRTHITKILKIHIIH